MIASLEHAVSKLNDLSEADQDRLAYLINAFTQKETSCANSLEIALAVGEAEVEAGEAKPVRQSFESLKAGFKAKHGL